jgi:hypothetical protein
MLDVLTGYPNQNGDATQPAATTETAVFDGHNFAWSSGTNTAGDSTLRLTLYTGASHDAWTETYANTAVWDWLLKQGAPPDMTTSSSSGAGGAGGEGGGSTSSASPSGGSGGSGGSSSSGGHGGAHPGAGGADATGGDSSDSDNPKADSGCAIVASATPAPFAAFGIALAFAALIRRRDD